MRYFACFLYAFLLVISRLIAQESPTNILQNKQIELVIGNAINQTYNFEFDKAETVYRQLKAQYPTHPMPVFLQGLNLWWRLMPNTDDEQYDEAFLEAMDEAIRLATAMYKKDRTPETIFFLSAANAFKARLYGERRKWSKAIGTSRAALSYLKEGRKSDLMDDEFLFGDGLYNYYYDWLYEEYILLRPVMLMFKKGDKTLGMQQLKRCANFSFYTRTEAQYFIARIYYNEENNPKEALPYIEYLYETFPNNAVFHRMYATVLFQMGNFKTLQPVAVKMLEQVDANKPGYEGMSGRYASYFLGYIARMYGQHAEAKHYFERSVAFSEAIGAESYGYYHSSLAFLAEYAQQEKDLRSAKRYYQKLKKHVDRKSKYTQEAKEFLKTHKNLRLED
ncbi:tetratricopeptide repeat protein [Eisenibacter elegans]|jgi:tetratricopeptide (TPR) repeat protein|uniref:tetratricopeptide repeat protein n=1 Tax=Eisenibacter elegans TaxID=997 RepID=UPI00054EA5F6|nr:hypothetical protein [Eisenibacter elegans]